MLLPGVFLLLITLQSLAQYNCASNSFYALGSDRMVYQLTINGSTVTIGPAVTNASSGSLFGLAMANLNGGGDTLYAVGNSNTIQRYDGSSWQTILTSSNVLQNGGGQGNFLYFQNLHVPALGAQYQNRIDAFNGSQLTTIWADSIRFTTVSDLAVDNGGNVYVFTGMVQDHTDTLRIFSSSGNLIQAIPVSFDGSNAYGLFISDSTLYVGLGPSNLTNPNTLLPVTLSNGLASVGSPITVPYPVIGSSSGGAIHLSFTDFETCASSDVLLSAAGVQEEEEPIAFPNPFTDHIYLDSRCTTAELYNLSGKEIKKVSEKKIDCDKLPPGLYLLRMSADNHIVDHVMIKE